MPRKSNPVNLIVHNGKKHLTKSEIEHRQKAEAAITPPANKVKPPKWLSRPAKKEFKRLIKEMAETKLITNADINALAAYCDAYVDYIECTRIIGEEGLMVEYTNKAGETNRIPHPLFTRKKQLHEQMIKIASEFGFTPCSRAKIALPKKEKKEPTAFEQRFGDRI